MQHARLDDDLAGNLALAAHVSNTLVLAGSRQFDRVMLRGAGTAAHRVVSIERLCHESLGVQATWVYDPATRRVHLVRAGAASMPETRLPRTVGGAWEAGGLPAVIDALDTLPPANGRCAMIVDADLLMEDAMAPREADFRALQGIERFSRNGCSHLLILRTGRTGNLSPIIVASPHIRTVHIPTASRDVRYAYASGRGQRLARICGAASGALAETVANTTEGWSLSQVEALVETAERQDIRHLSALEGLAQAVKLGATQSPWAGERIRHEIARATETLTQRVSGQPAAVEEVVVTLRKAVVGLSDAHQSQGSSSPRGVFFLAGPTGSGKTEMAKAVSRIIFGQDDLIRFDCGELRQEHAVARLVGAPPGYVGFDRGGELTEAIMARPNSVILFDEIEKAHPRLMDVLLGVLDDGRLTSGQGQTAHFGQAVVIFTSNLGMYEEVADRQGRMTRQPRFGHDTPFETIQRGVRAAIQQEFVTNLGRPELLGRLGGPEAIVVFDHLHDLESVCRKFVGNIVKKCENLHNLRVDVDPSVIEAVAAASRQSPDSLLLGGRGLKSMLDRMFTNPLSNHIFSNILTGGTVHARVENGTVAFVSRERAAAMA